MNLLTKFHEDWKINVASRVHIMKNASPLGSHVFQAKFHEDRKIHVSSRMLTRKNAPPPGGHVFQPTGIIFKLVQDIIEMNHLTKKNAPPLGSHTIFVASRGLTRQMLTRHNVQWATDKKRSQKLTMSMLCSGELKNALSDPIQLLTKFGEDRMKTT
ncbi:hypothetical protein DPMN_166866 [Dreissena polymorpha]|uniref:Uncharacterized protein n=1 Tax=Dreissena polymorpha TaxID=45954 RepID=A0A9D4IY98_DREPO|nr:hypothetical protein DPMN_166866 [Dreissena polymorpha]